MLRAIAAAACGRIYLASETYSVKRQLADNPDRHALFPLLVLLQNVVDLIGEVACIVGLALLAGPVLVG